MNSSDSNRPGDAPVILIGMHRSGTTLLARLLERLGLFMGRQKESNHESIFFQRLNEWLLSVAGARWDRPESFGKLLEAPETRDLAMDYLRRSLRSPRATSFVGWMRYLAGQHPLAMRQAWGWKDPRNTFTLPLWLELFPAARVIHISRHGVDVAASLRRRQEEESREARRIYMRRKFLYNLCWKRGGFTDTLRSRSLEGGFSLWEEYVVRARTHTQRLGSRALELSYAELVAEPRAHLEGVARFLGLEASDAALETASAMVNRKRVHAFVEKPELCDFARQVAPRLESLGFEALPQVHAGSIA